MDKLIRFAVLPRGGEPVIWDFGSAAKHHQLYNPWLDYDRKPDNGQVSEAATEGRSGARAGHFHTARRVPSRRRHRPRGRPQGGERAARARPQQRANRRRCDRNAHPECTAERRLTVVDGQQVFLEARRIKTVDEIALLAQACSMVDAAYDELYAFLRPGVRENECVGLVSKVLYDLGSEYVEGVNAISGERCSPHPHVYSDRIVRPVIRHSSTSCTATSAIGPATTAAFAVGSASPAMRDAYVRCREYMDMAIAAVKPGATTADIALTVADRGRVRIRQRGSRFALQYGHGVGLAIWEKPIFSRLVSLDHPEVLEEGMVFALETYWPASDGWSAARIEEEVVVTAEGCEVITKFPAEGAVDRRTALLDVGGELPTLRESQSHLNTMAGRGET
jgi:Xaa-Pro aminopeptidase